MDAKTLPEDLLTEIRDAAKSALSAQRDPQMMKDARARMLALREEIFRKHGLLDIGVPALREFRDGKNA